MRNRYFVSIVMAVLAVVLGGCSRNPDVAKRKYLESGMKYMEQEKYDSAAIQFKKPADRPQVRRRSLPAGERRYETGKELRRLQGDGPGGGT